MISIGGGGKGGGNRYHKKQWRKTAEEDTKP